MYSASFLLDVGAIVGKWWIVSMAMVRRCGK
jgi:hypothetical protein